MAALRLMPELQECAERVLQEKDAGDSCLDIFATSRVDEIALSKHRSVCALSVTCSR
jgi:hypothetical protein